MSTKYSISIQCLPECEHYTSGWRDTDDVGISDPVEAIRVLGFYSRLTAHRATIYIDEEVDD